MLAWASPTPSCTEFHPHHIEFSHFLPPTGPKPGPAGGLLSLCRSKQKEGDQGQGDGAEDGA